MKRAAALPTVLFALCIVGALTVGGAHVSRRAADDANADRQALDLGPLAEEALAEVVAAWNPDTAGAMLTGSVAQAPDLVRPGVRVRLWLTRLTAGEYWLVAEAERTRKPLLRKRLTVVVRVDSGGVQPAPQVAWFELP